MQRIALVFLALLLAAPAARAAPEARSVPTETITAPKAPGMEIAPDTEAEPDPIVPPTAPQAPGAGSDGAPEAAEPVPAIEYDVAKLPVPVRRLREQLLDAAKSGDIEKLRPIIEANPEPPTLSLDEIGDPIAHLKSLSGDPDGREILAILSEVLEAGYVHVDIGTPQELYIWPYFARVPLDGLTPPQLVEMFRLLTASDYEEMKSYGAYVFYRTGITPDGAWAYFVSGE